MSHIYLNELFYSLQGEGSRTGFPCVFVRLRGCPLRCHYCDTAYAFHEGSKYTFEDILKEGEAKGGDCTFWQLTGGEPLAQKTSLDLVTFLCDHGKEVVIETSGAVPIKDIDRRAVFVLDVKTPGSGEAGKMVWENLSLLTKRDEVKFVLTSRADYDWMLTIIDKYQLADQAGSVLVSAAAEMAEGKYIKGCAGVAIQDVADWLLKDQCQNLRLQTQLHKIIWDPMARGV